MAGKPFPNKFGATCKDCGQRVEAGAGLCARADDGVTWEVRHIDGECGTQEPGAVDTAASGSASPSFPPTPEQDHALDIFNTKKSFKVEAGAGCGKTTLLLHLATNTTRTGRYVAFNKSVVTDIGKKLPKNVVASTAHALAHSAICKGTPFLGRLENSSTLKSSEVARKLNLGAWSTEDGQTLSARHNGAAVLRAVRNFCLSADETISARHVEYVEGIDEPGPRGARTYANNKLFAKFLLPYVKKAWKDLSSEKGTLPYKPDHYVKQWQLTHPKLPGDFILLDEAQDLNPVLVAIVDEQTHLQRVYVGDSNQSIYEFTGAINALATVEVADTCYLTQSFRFGQAIADAANEVLAELNSPLKLKGLDKIESKVHAFTHEPDAILCRTNAGAIDTLLSAQQRGVKAYLVGGGKETLRFARAAKNLREWGHCDHPDLAIFKSWVEVEEYVKEDGQGADLKLNVDLINKYGIETIIDTLSNLPHERDAVLTISTAHKAKGLEWDSVRIAGDFVKKPEPGEKKPGPRSPQELRLLYVALTRAQKHLDKSVLEENHNENYYDDEGRAEV